MWHMRGRRDFDGAEGQEREKMTKHLGGCQAGFKSKRPNTDEKLFLKTVARRSTFRPLLFGQDKLNSSGL